MITSRCSVGAVLALVLQLLIPVASVCAQDTEVQDVNAADVKLRVDGDRIKGYIEWMSRDKLEGRKTLTRGYRQAADWAAANFKKWGLKPAGEDGTYFQNVVIKRKFTYRAGRPDLKVGKHLFLMEEEDFSVHDASTAATSVKAEVVFVGYGISAPDMGLDEYADVNVAGNIALVLTGSPNDVSTDRRDDSNQEKPSDPWQDHVSDQTKIKTAYEKGAAAVLLHDINPPEPESSGRRSRDSGEEEDPKFERNFLVFTISGRVCRAIMKTDSQESVRGFQRRLEQMKKDISHKKAQSQLAGTEVQLKGYDRVEEYSEEKKNNKGRNVLAKIEGTDPELKDQYVVMGGHLDHLGMRSGYVYNGADDNASGTAAAMEVARVLSEADFKPKRTIIFACWTGEELGLLGSKHYVSKPCDGVSIDRVVTYFNLDMVGLGETVGAPGALNFPSIWDVIKRDQDEDVIAAIEPRTGGPGGSDHSAFIEKGIESLALMTRGGAGHGDYHRPEDDAAKIDPEILRKTGQFVLQGTINLANETKVNLIIEDRQALYDGMRLYVENINPELKDSDWSIVNIDSTDQDKLRWRVASVEDKPKRTLDKGIKDLRVFAGDMELLLAASEALGFGRVDIQGSDGAWIEKGRLTRKGRYDLGMLEEERIVVNLLSPSLPLLRAMLSRATRPFMVTGYYHLNKRLCEQINEKKVLLGVKFDPQNVDGCVERLEKAKAALGDSDNLVLYVTSTEGLDEAKKDLYVRLIKKGWKAEEIGSARKWRPRDKERPTGISAGNLSALR
jgi:hypothetical protein